VNIAVSQTQNTANGEVEEKDLEQEQQQMNDHNDNEQVEAIETSEHADVSIEDKDGAEAHKLLAEEHYQKLLRVQADYDNFRRRSRLEKEDFAKYASLKLIEQLLPIYDNFDRALQAGKETTDTDAFLKGVDMIFRQFATVLEAEGVTPIEAVGHPFNPEFHQAIMQVESNDHEEGIVVEEIQKGYMMKDKVIRPSMVKVSS
jgi:molecular chaperone GrpE